jgi:hypothetical protein
MVGKPTIEKATRKNALELLQTPAVPGDRALSKVRLELYQRCVRKGSMRDFSWARVYCKETGETYRVNGKHTSTLVATWNAADEGPLPILWAAVSEFEADTLADVADLYGTFDSRVTSRSTPEINRTFADVIPGLAEYHDRNIGCLVSGLNYSPYPTAEERRKTATERAEVLLTHETFCVWAMRNLIRDDAAAAKKDSSKLRAARLARAPVVQAIFRTYQLDPVQALAFWRVVRDDDGPGMGKDGDSPSRKLGFYLNNVRMSATRSEVRRTKRTAARDDVVNTGGDPREIHAKCREAWNAFRQNRPTSLRYYATAKDQAAFV